MDTYNKILLIVLNSFGIDIGKITINDASEILIEKTINDQNVEFAVQEILNSIYKYKETDQKTYEEMIICLVRDFISKSLDSESAMLKLLDMWSINEVLVNFTKIPSFAKNLVEHFVYNLFKSDDKIIENYENFGLLQKFSDEIGISYLNDVIRDSLNRVNSYFNNPKETYEFLETAFFNDAPITNVPLHNAVVVLRCYQKLVMRLIYADVYEWLSILDDSKAGRTHLKTYIENCVNKGNFSLDPSFGAENEAIFNYFFYLNREKRNANHQTTNLEQKSILKRINPLYMIESSGIIKK